jgi:hypothetical protein
MNHRTWLGLALPLALAACTADRAASPREVFDEQTGNTLTVVAKPLVFARERSDLAAHARDYATLVAVEVDHSGTSADYLLVYRWSTVDRRMLPRQDAGGGRLRLIGGGRELNLLPIDTLPVGLDSMLSLHMPAHGAASTRAYAVDVDTLHFIALSSALTLRLPQEPLDAPFQVWEDGRPALERFVRQTSVP